MKKYDVGFSVCDNKGFHIRFPNGLTLSTQFGGGNYGSNYDFRIGKERDGQGMEAETVEVAVFRTEGKGDWLTSEIAQKAGLGDQNDDVIGYVPFDDWLKIFDATKNF